MAFGWKYLLCLSSVACTPEGMPGGEAREDTVAHALWCLHLEQHHLGQPYPGEWKFLLVGWERHTRALFPIIFI